MLAEHRLALRGGFLFLLAVGALVQGSYRYGSPLRAVLLLGTPGAMLIYALVLTRRRRGAPGMLDAARQRVEGALAAIGRARRRNHVRRVEQAAATAVDGGNEVLSPEGVRRAAESLLRLVVIAWNDRDRGLLVTLLGAELLPDWERWIAEASRSRRDERLEVVGDVRVEYVGFTADERLDGTRVVVLIEATLAKRLEDRPRRHQRTERLCQYWTLAFDDGVWTVLKIEERRAGEHHLSEPVGGLATARS